jgi:dihydroorotase
MVSNQSEVPGSITLRRPDDWHVHLRDGAMLAQVVRHTARQFARAVVMPNLLHRSEPSPQRAPIASAFLQHSAVRPARTKKMKRASPR